VPRCRQYRTVETGARVISATSAVVRSSLLGFIVISIRYPWPAWAGLTRHRHIFDPATANRVATCSGGGCGGCSVLALMATHGSDAMGSQWANRSDQIPRRPGAYRASACAGLAFASVASRPDLVDTRAIGLGKQPRETTGTGRSAEAPPGANRCRTCGSSGSECVPVPNERDWRPR
jgi:hypothetical protein